MRIGQVVEVSVRILRRRWAVLLSVAALLVGPAALMGAATSVRFTEVAGDIFPGLRTGEFDADISVTNAEFERLLGAFGVYAVAVALAGVLGTIGAVGFSAVVGADYHGRAMGLSQALLVCLRRALSALAVIVVTTLIIVGTIVAGVALMAVAASILSGGGLESGGPGAFIALIIGVGLFVIVLYLTLRWAMVLPVLAIEDSGWRKGLSRSWHLSGDNVWRTLVVMLLGALLTLIIGALLTQLLGLLIVDVLAKSLELDEGIASTLSSALGSILVAPIGAVLMAVLYFDLRARRDMPAALPKVAEYR
jgi:hypothetical protein